MKLKVVEDVLVQEVAGELVFLNIASERYSGLDEVGTAMWHAITETDSVDAAHERLLAEYDVTAEQLTDDLQELVQQLTTSGILRAIEE